MEAIQSTPYVKTARVGVVVRLSAERLSCTQVLNPSAMPQGGTIVTDHTGPHLRLLMVHDGSLWFIEMTVDNCEQWPAVVYPSCLMMVEKGQ